MAVRALNEATEIRELSKVMALAPTANSLDNIFVAPDVAADGVSFKYTGRDIVTVKNTDATDPFTFTLKGVAVPAYLNRTGDVGPYTLQAGEEATILISDPGFKDGQGKVLIVMEDVAVKVAVCRAPNVL